MAKTFEFERFDVFGVDDYGDDISPRITAASDGEWIKAQAAIDREKVNADRIAALEAELAEAQRDANAWRRLMDNIGSSHPHVYITGYAVLPCDAVNALSEPPPPSWCMSVQRVPIRQVIFRWVDKGDAPTLRDAMQQLRSSTT